ncbi:MAG: cyanoexosortase A [Cyanobacteria bacterium J06555_13]
MKAIYRPSKQHQFWMLSVAAGLAFIHISLVWAADDTNLLCSSLIFWPAAFVLAKEVDLSHSQSGELRGARLGLLVVGLCLLGANLLQALLNKGTFLYLYPFFAGIGVVTSFAGLSGFRSYWKSLMLLFFLGVPEVLMYAIVDPAPLTARFADVLLWYTGHDVVRDSVWLHLPGGSVEVNQACSGLRAMTRLLGMAVLSLLCLPRRWPLREVVMLPLIGIGIAFLLNGIRVALLAILHAAGHEAAFESLHGGSTSQLFSIVSIFLLMSIIWWLIQHFPQDKLSDVNSLNSELD